MSTGASDGGRTRPSWFASSRLLLGLRYRLLWAQVRSGPGRVAVLAAGLASAALMAVLLAVGGFGAAAAAVRSGQGELVAQVILTGVFLNAVFVAILLGLGVQPAFSDVSLRRYPVSRAVRRAVGHVLALLDPIWIIVFALILGLGAGFAALGGGAPVATAPAALLFVVTGYLLARIIARAGEWAMTRPGGPLGVAVIGVALMMAIPLLPAMLTRGRGETMRWTLEYFPPFAAARMITHAGWPAIGAACVLAGWCIGLSGMLAAVERLPHVPRARAGAAPRHRHPADFVAALFGPARAALAGKFLRYQLRSPQVRYNYPLVLPVLVFTIGFTGDNRDTSARFLSVLGALPAAAFLATGALSINLFGFDGHGFRRYFLLPISGAELLRTSALVGLLPGACLVPMAVAIWWLLFPSDTTWLMLALLISSGFAGLLLFQALAMWTSLLAPRPIPLDATFGNKLSPAANVLFVAAMVVFFGLPVLLQDIGLVVVLSAWWYGPIALLFSAACFFGTLRAGSRTLVARRERVLAALEG